MDWTKLFMFASAMAEDAGAAAGTAADATAQGGVLALITSMLPLVLIVVVFYFMLIRPQRKKDKEAKTMLDNLKVGDRICTIGGIYATIVRIKDDVLTVEVGDQKTQMMIARWAVRNVEQLSVTNDSEQLI